MSEGYRVLLIQWWGLQRPMRSVHLYVLILAAARSTSNFHICRCTAANTQVRPRWLRFINYSDNKVKCKNDVFLWPGLNGCSCVVCAWWPSTRPAIEFANFVISVVTMRIFGGLFCRREALPVRFHRLRPQILSLRPVKEAPAQTYRYTGIKLSYLQRPFYFFERYFWVNPF